MSKLSFSLRSILTLPFVLGVSTVTVVTVGLFTSYEQHLQATLKQELIQQTQEELRKDLQDLLAIPHQVNQLNQEVVGQDPQFLEGYFRRQLQRFPVLEEVAWLPRQGGMIAATRSGNPILRDPQGLDLKGLKQAGWLPTEDLVAVLPLPQGVLLSELEPTALQQVIQHTPVARLVLLDRGGKILADSSGDPQGQIPPQWLATRIPLSLRQQEAYVLVLPMRDPYGWEGVAVAWIPWQAWEGLPGLGWLLGGIGLLLLGVIGVGTALSRSIGRSIEGMMQQATCLALGAPVAPTPASPMPIRELQQMAEAFEMILGKISNSFEQITNTIPGLIYRSAYPDQQILYINSRLKDILGYQNPQDFQSLFDKVHPDDRPIWERHWQALQAAADNQVWSLVLRLRHHNQSYRWLQIHEVVFRRHPQGSPAEILGVAIDVTDTHLLQTDLLVSEQRFRILLENLNIGVVVQDLKTRILFHNPAALELLGLTSEQLLGKTSFDPQWRVIHEDGSPFLPQDHPVSQVIATGQPVHNVVMGVYRPQEDEPIWLSVNGDPLLNEKGEIEEVLVSFADISVRMRAQQILKEHNLALSSLAESSTLQLSQSLRLMSLSQKITEHLRSSLDEKEILQRVVEELVPALGLVFANIGIYDLERQCSTISYEYSTLSEQGLGLEIPFSHSPPIYRQLFQGIPFQVSVLEGLDFRTHRKGFLKLACPIRDEQGTWADLWCVRAEQVVFTEQEVAFVQQIAADCAIAVRQARLYAAAQAQVKALEQLNYLKDDFISTVSHELRTPLATMKMAIKLLRSTQGESALTNKQLQYLTMLETECEREISIINDLLDLQRLSAYGADSQIKSIDVYAWIEEIAAAFRLRAQSREQALIVDCPKSLPPLVSDPYLLDRVVRELLTNACKYTPPQESIHLRVEQQGDHLQIRVINTGVAIPPELTPKIFEKFYRIPSQDRWKQGGTGLGLALVKQICQTLGATVTVENCPDPAVAFNIRIPIHPGAK
ncbi:MAG: ATP-binding protein [Thermostichales cyanobacterium HHBFW_bins_127]